MLVGAVLALVLLEAGLQVAAWVVWARADGGPSGGSVGGGSRGPVVLCLGDSFTFGLGATDPAHAWPSVAARRLEDRGEPAVFANAAWPGSNSRDVLAGMGARLREWQPDLVYLLVGTNDRWSRPDPLPDGAEQDAAPRRFPWRLRSLRLLRLIAQPRATAGGDVAGADPREVDGPAPAAPGEDGSRAPFLGEWQIGPHGVVFEPDGRLLVAGTILYWVAAGDEIRVRTADEDAFAMAWRREGDVLRLRSPLWPGPVELRLGLPPGEQRVRAARDLLAAGEVDRAEQELRRCLDEPGAPPMAREALIGVLRTTGRVAEAEVERARMRAAFSESRDPTLGEALLRVDVAAADEPAAQATAREIASAAPGAAELLGYALGLPAARTDVAVGLARAAAAAARAQGSAELEALWLRVVAERVRTVDPPAALAAVADAWAIDHDATATRHHLARLRWWIDPGIARDLLDARSDLPAEERARLLDWLGEDAGDGGGARGATLADHLRRAVVLARGAGAGVVLLSYPRGEDLHTRVAADVAAETGCGWLDVRPAFARALESRPVEELFIPDGHCTDDGYAILGAAVAEDAAVRLATKRGR